MRTFRTLLFALLLALGGCYDNATSGSVGNDVGEANCSIAQLRTLCEDGCYLITSDLICVGRVTTSDKEGNFYRSLFVEDATGGVEVLLGIYNSHSLYPEGTEVALHLDGTAVMKEGEVVQVGLAPESYDLSLREFESQALIDRHIARGTSVEKVAPRVYLLSDLDATLCGQLIEIQNLTHTASLDTECTTLEGYHAFTDESGNTLYTSVSSYADFADSTIPEGRVLLRGVLLHEAVGLGIGRQYVIKPRYEDDIATLPDSY